MSYRITGLVAAVAFTAILSSGAQAQNVMKECGAEYQTAKAANTLGGKKWQEFLSECRTRHASATSAPASTAAAPTMPAAPATPPASTAAAPAAPTTAAKPASGGRAAMLDRERTCGAEWKAQKVELRKTQPGLKWPQYWSACNKRLKAAAAQ